MAEIYNVTFSPDGKSLASAGNREVKVWDLPGGKERFSYPIKGTNVFGLPPAERGKPVALLCGTSQKGKPQGNLTGQRERKREQAKAGR